MFKYAKTNFCKVFELLCAGEDLYMNCVHESSMTLLSLLCHRQVGPDTESEMDRTYRKVLTKLPEGSQVLDDAYGAVQKIVGDFKKYVNVSVKRVTHINIPVDRFMIHVSNVSLKRVTHVKLSSDQLLIHE